MVNYLAGLFLLSGCLQFDGATKNLCRDQSDCAEGYHCQEDICTLTLSSVLASDFGAVTDSVPPQADQVPCYSNNEYSCSCSPLSAGAADDQGCGKAQIRGSAICCAQPGWPSRGSTCYCHEVRCNQTERSCVCGPSNTEVEGSVSSCTSTTCCKSNDTPFCMCLSTTTGCSSDMTKVSSCSISSLECDKGYQTTSQCR